MRGRRHRWAVFSHVTVDGAGTLVVEAAPGPSPSFGQSYTNAIQIQSVHAIPEPASIMLVNLVGVAIICVRRRRRR